MSWASRAQLLICFVYFVVFAHLLINFWVQDDEDENDSSELNAQLMDYSLFLLKEKHLFTDRIGAESDSTCSLPVLETSNTTKINKIQSCNSSRTFIWIKGRTLHINCTGKAFINFNYKPDSEAHWSEFNAPITIPWPTQFVDIKCEEYPNEHNVRTQFLPDLDKANKARQMLLKSQQKELIGKRPVSLLIIQLDAVSRAQFVKPNGFPKSTNLIKKLYYSHFSPNATHQAFMFNRFNSFGESSENLISLFTGELHHSNAEDFSNINEWIWDYASRLGYLTMMGSSGENGFLNGKLLPETWHFSFPYIRTENTDDNEGCAGDVHTSPLIFNYTRDYFLQKYQAKWATISVQVNDNHDLVDTELHNLLDKLIKSEPRLAVILIGNHGKSNNQQSNLEIGTIYERSLPLLSIIIPTFVFQKYPNYEEILYLNQERLTTHLDLHKTLKTLLHYPHFTKARGSVSQNAINLIRKRVTKKRTCNDALLSENVCVCHLYHVEIPNDKITVYHTQLAFLLLGEVNRNFQTLNDTTCLPLSLLSIERVLQLHGQQNATIYDMVISTEQGNSRWQGQIDGTNYKIYDIHQLLDWSMYENCRDIRVDPEFCICNTNNDHHE